MNNIIELLNKETEYLNIKLIMEYIKLKNLYTSVDNLIDTKKEIVNSINIPKNHSQDVMLKHCRTSIRILERQKCRLFEKLKIMENNLYKKIKEL